MSKDKIIEIFELMELLELRGQKTNNINNTDRVYRALKLRDHFPVTMIYKKIELILYML